MPGTAVAVAAGAGAGGAGGQQERPGLGTQPRQEYNLVNKGIFLSILSVQRIRIRGLFDPRIRDTGWVKNQDPNPG